jgi:hypothetical protein
VRVDWAIPCRYVEVAAQGGATIVGAGADLIQIPEAPAPVQVLFAVRFVGAPEELDDMMHPVAARIFNPNGQMMGEQAGQITVAGTLRVPGYAAELTVPMGVVIDAREFGTYSVEFEIDGDTRRVPIHIVEPIQPTE